ncbi:MAG: hypothetical protein OXJ52_04200 [Oligoflexia bacterium]|nr:hypothetical protein [Oligoflexia bacterium]
MKTALIEPLVSQVQIESICLTELKASDKSKKQEYEHYLKSIAEFRGRSF